MSGHIQLVSLHMESETMLKPELDEFKPRAELSADSCAVIASPN